MWVFPCIHLDWFVLVFIVSSYSRNRTLSHNAETKDFARPTSHPVRGWTGKNKAFCSPGTQNGRRVIKVYACFVMPGFVAFLQFSLPHYLVLYIICHFVHRFYQLFYGELVVWIKSVCKQISVNTSSKLNCCFNIHLRLIARPEWQFCCHNVHMVINQNYRMLIHSWGLLDSAFSWDPFLRFAI